jgi:hypothetical protein
MGKGRTEILPFGALMCAQSAAPPRACRCGGARSSLNPGPRASLRSRTTHYGTPAADRHSESHPNVDNPSLLPIGPGTVSASAFEGLLVDTIDRVP